ncbi:MAG TPA: hypothetical protein VGP93_12480, partial [Polyangiaceae bacterium]|nr:hypothetical protein [Polyangiaceae bacterium]
MVASLPARPTGTIEEGLLVLGGPSRNVGLLDWPPRSEHPTSLAEVTAALGSDASRRVSWTLTGGEITLRADLPELLSAVAEVTNAGPGLWTDGLSLGDAPAVDRLRRAGLARARITFCCARADAHDW